MFLNVTTSECSENIQKYHSYNVCKLIKWNVSLTFQKRFLNICDPGPQNQS